MSVKQNLFFLSRAVKPERDYKKTHAMVMSNANRACATAAWQRCGGES
jgi:hypothetical protein